MQINVSHANGTVTASGRCLVTGKPHSVTVPLVGYLRWIRDGLKIQDAMPSVPAADREWFISEISPEGWELVNSVNDDAAEADSDGSPL